MTESTNLTDHQKLMRRLSFLKQQCNKKKAEIDQEQANLRERQAAVIAELCMIQDIMQSAEAIYHGNAPQISSTTEAAKKQVARSGPNPKYAQTRKDFDAFWFKFLDSNVAQDFHCGIEQLRSIVNPCMKAVLLLLASHGSPERFQTRADILGGLSGSVYYREGAFDGKVTKGPLTNAIAQLRKREMIRKKRTGTRASDWAWAVRLQGEPAETDNIIGNQTRRL